MRKKKTVDIIFHYLKDNMDYELIMLVHDMASSHEWCAMLDENKTCSDLSRRVWWKGIQTTGPNDMKDFMNMDCSYIAGVGHTCNWLVDLHVWIGYNYSFYSLGNCTV
jgi:hypothetical protein